MLLKSVVCFRVSMRSKLYGHGKYFGQKQHTRSKGQTNIYSIYHIEQGAHKREKLVCVQYILWCLQNLSLLRIINTAI